MRDTMSEVFTGTVSVLSAADLWKSEASMKLTIL